LAYSSRVKRNAGISLALLVVWVSRYGHNAGTLAWAIQWAYSWLDYTTMLDVMSMVIWYIPELSLENEADMTPGEQSELAVSA